MLLELWMSAVQWEPLGFWFCLLDCQSLKAIVAKTLLLSPCLQLVGEPVGSSDALTFYSGLCCLHFLSGALFPEGRQNWQEEVVVS